MLAGTFASLLLAPALLFGAPAPLAAPAGPVVPAATANPVTWEIDTSHSELTFRIRHLVSRVRGSFNEWGGTIVADPRNLVGGRVDVTIQTASIDTGNERRDVHLRNEDFFNAPARRGPSSHCDCRLRIRWRPSPRRPRRCRSAPRR